MKKSKIARLLSAFALSMLLFIGFDAGRAVAQGPYARDNLRSLTMSKLWASFRNYGQQGGTLENRNARMVYRLTYPGSQYGNYLYNLPDPQKTDYKEYWGDKGWADEEKVEPAYISIGDGVWVLTDVGGKKHASRTGPIEPSVDVTPMIYDIRNSPEVDLGLNARAPGRDPYPQYVGTPMSNWWRGGKTVQEVNPSIDATSAQPYEILNRDYGRYIDRTGEAEDIIITQWTTQNGITVTRKARAWSFQDFDDFFILEVEFANTGDANGDGKPDVNGGKGYNLKDVYFSFMNGFYVTNSGHAWRYGNEGGIILYSIAAGLDDWLKYTEAPNYNGPAAGVGKMLVYQYDGDSPLSPDEDTGEPFILGFENPGGQFPGSSLRPEGMFIAPQYIGMAPLAFRNSGPSHVFNARDKAAGYVDPKSPNPVAFQWWPVYGRRNIDWPDPNTRTPADVYAGLTDPKPKMNPTPEGMFWNCQTFGPYDLDVGQKAKIVLVYVGGTGAEYQIDPKTGYAVDMIKWSQKGPMPVEARKAELAKGADAILQNLSHAQFAYNNGYNIPKAPPDVDLKIVSNEKAQNRLVWKDDGERAINPDYGEADVVAYRVYQSFYQEYGPWELLDEIPAKSNGPNWKYANGAYTYDDGKSLAGFNYFYSVRSVSKGHPTWSNGISTINNLPATIQQHVQKGQESGYSAPEQFTSTPYNPTQPVTAAGEKMDLKVYVVPNPFSLGDATRNYQGNKDLRFVGLPSTCRILLYTVSGEVWAEWIHNAASGESKWDQRNRMNTAEMPTGLYFWVVESMVPESRGKMAKGKLVIIR